MVSGGTHAQGLFETNEKDEGSKGIRASLLPDKKSVYLLWEPSDRDKEVIIARSNSVIDTPEKLYVADSMGRFSSKSKNSVTNYYDYNLKPGSYYYAVVPVEDVRTRTVRLLPDKNFTTKPIQINKGSSSDSNSGVVPEEGKGNSRTVGAIILKAENNNIRVNWVPPWNAKPGKTTYSIYKSNSPLSSMKEMEKADKLAEIPHPINTYLDRNIEKSQTLYYGVSVKDEKTEEVLPLEKGKSYVRIFFIKDKDGRSEAIRDSEPTEIRKSTTGEENSGDKFMVLGFGYERIGKGAKLKWTPPANADKTTQYTIYASTSSFETGVNSFVGGTVLKVGTLSHPKTSLMIKEIKPVDSLYFAITSKKAGVPENFDLVEGISYFKYNFDSNKSVQTVSNSSPRPNGSVGEKPSRADGSPEDKKDPSDTPSLGKKPEQEEIKETSPSNPSIAKETESENNIGLNIDMREGKRLDWLLRKYYKNKKFEIASMQLEKYAKNERDEYLRGKAYFYAGISRYRCGDYRIALNHFLKMETSQFHPRRTKFWKNQTLSKIRGER